LEASLMQVGCRFLCVEGVLYAPDEK